MYGHDFQTRQGNKQYQVRTEVHGKLVMYSCCILHSLCFADTTLSMLASCRSLLQMVVT